MDFTLADAKRTLKILAPIAATVPSKTGLPILSCVLIEAHKKNGVRFTATDLDIFVRRTVEAKVEAPGRIAVPWRLLKSALAGLPAKAPVHFAVETVTGKGGDSGTFFTVACGSMSARINATPATEYPIWFKRERGNLFVDYTVTLPATTLQQCARVLPFASTEEYRPSFNGAMLEILPSKVRGVATNGHRLALVEQDADTSSVPLMAETYGQLILPPLVLDLLADGDENVTIDWQNLVTGKGKQTVETPHHAWITAGPLEITTRLIEGPYPHYRQIIPRENTRVWTLDRKEFLGIVKRITKFADKATHRIVLETQPFEMTVSARTIDTGTTSETLYVETDRNSATLRIAFNGSYLADCLATLTGLRVRITLHDSANYTERAAVVTDPDDPNVTLLLMPLRLMD